MKKREINDKFITLNNIIQLLNESKLKCIYCDENIYIIYKFSRELKQWSLDRIDNNIGHEKDNVVISCLACNLNRKNKNHEKFLYTKQLKIFKSNDNI